MKPKSPFCSSKSLIFSSAIAVAFSVFGQADAANVTWDITPGTVGAGDSAITGGAGTWNTTNGNWTTDTGANNVAWVNANNDVAIFGDVAGAVALGEPITAGGLKFDTTGYSVTGSTLTLGGATPNITVANTLTATIGSVLAGTVGYNVGTVTTGTGTLNLSGANTYTGITTVNYGTLNIQNDSAFGSTAGGTADGTVLAPGSTTATLSFPGGVNVLNEPLNARGGGVGNFGALRNLAGDNSWTGNIVLSNSLRVTSDSGTLTLGNIDTQPSGSVRSFIMNGAGNVTVNGVVGGTGVGAGGNVSVDNLNNVVTPGTLTLNGADTYAGTTTLVGGGTVTLAGARTVASGNIIVTQGILNMSGARTGSAGTITLGNGDGHTATLNLSNGDFATSAMTIGTTVLNATTGLPGTGIVNHSGGILSTPGQILMGTFNTSSTIGAGTGSYNLSGGSLKSSNATLAALCIGTQTGGTATFNLSGTGVLEMTGVGGILQIGRSSSTTTSSTGTFNQTGGTASLLNVAMGNSSNSNTTSVLNLTGGTFTAATAFTAMAAGATSTATITIGGTADVTLPAFPIARGTGSTATITFDGGILRPTAASLAYISGMNSATIQDGGATFNVASGNDIVIPQALLTHGSSLGGGLTKLGTGALVLSGANTYTGATTVSDGTLSLVGGSQASPITVQNGAFLGFDVASTTTSTSTVTLAAGARVRIVGTPTLASYTLMTATAFSPNPQLETPIAGYSLVVDGTSLKLNATGGSYNSWASANGIPGQPASGDFDNDGLSNLVEYALNLNPTVSTVPPGSFNGSLLSFTKGSEALANGDVTYEIEQSTTLSGWTVVVPNNSSLGTISYTLPAGQPKVFARLKITQIP